MAYEERYDNLPVFTLEDDIIFIIVFFKLPTFISNINQYWCRYTYNFSIYKNVSTIVPHFL